MQLIDVAIADTQPDQGNPMFGDGMQVIQGAQVHAERLAVAHNALRGVCVSDSGSRLEATDLIVEGTVGQTFARGLEVRLSASAQVERARFQSNAEMGVGAFDDRSTLSLSQVSLLGAPKPGLPAQPIGVRAAGSAVSLDHFEAREHSAAALLVEQGSLVAQDGAVVLNAIGAQVAQVSLMRDLMVRVLYDRNATTVRVGAE
jgi:hypothetical protein